jgi:hypothetical protein
MADHGLSKLSPIADTFKPGASGVPRAMRVPITNTKGELQFTRPEFLAQKEQISTVYKNYGENKCGDNNKNYGDNSENYSENTKNYGGFKKFKGKPFKSYKNKPQNRDQPALEPQPLLQPAFYMDEETLSTMCEAKRKAFGDGMKLVCVGCGAFAKYDTNPSHNWSSIMEIDYSGYLTSPLCPHSNHFKKPYSSRLAEKQ